MEQEFAEKIKSYSLEDLNSILLIIDKEKYPDRYGLVTERIEKLKNVGESLNVSDKIENREYDAWSRVARDYLLFAVSIFLVGMSVYFVSDSTTKKSNLSEVKGNIDVSYLDSSRSYRRHLYSRYYYNLTLQISGKTTVYKYFDDDPGFWKIVRRSKIGKDMEMLVDNKNKIWEISIAGEKLVSYYQNRKSDFKNAVYTFLIGAFGVLITRNTVWSGFKKWRESNNKGRNVT